MGVFINCQCSTAYVFTVVLIWNYLVPIIEQVARLCETSKVHGVNRRVKNGDDGRLEDIKCISSN